MGYVSKDEIDKFAYDDCVVTSFAMDDKGIVLGLEALIVKAKNSQNTNYTDSYAGDAVCELKAGKILSLIKEGYKYYDADDKLIDEVPDEELAVDAAKLKALFKEVYLISFAKEDDGNYKLEIEVGGEDPSDIADTYELTCSCDEVVVSWTHYMNRVQN